MTSAFNGHKLNGQVCTVCIFRFPSRVEPPPCPGRLLTPEERVSQRLRMLAEAIETWKARVDRVSIQQGDRDRAAAALAEQEELLVAEKTIEGLALATVNELASDHSGGGP